MNRRTNLSLTLALAGTLLAAPATALTLAEAYEEYRYWCEATGDRDYCDIAWQLYYELQDQGGSSSGGYGVGDLSGYTGLGQNYMSDVWGNQGRINSFSLSGN